MRGADRRRDCEFIVHRNFYHALAFFLISLDAPNIKAGQDHTHKQTQEDVTQSSLTRG